MLPTNQNERDRGQEWKQADLSFQANLLPQLEGACTKLNVTEMGIFIPLSPALKVSSYLFYA